MKKKIVVIAPYQKDFVRWHQLNGEFNVDYVWVNNQNYRDKLLGRQFDEIKETERSYLVSGEVFDMAKTRLR